MTRGPSQSTSGVASAVRRKSSILFGGTVNLGGRNSSPKPQPNQLASRQVNFLGNFPDHCPSLFPSPSNTLSVLFLPIPPSFPVRHPLLPSNILTLPHHPSILPPNFRSTALTFCYKIFDPNASYHHRPAPLLTKKN